MAEQFNPMDELQKLKHSLLAMYKQADCLWEPVSPSIRMLNSWMN
jgi:hypothetical protein